MTHLINGLVHNWAIFSIQSAKYWSCLSQSPIILGLSLSMNLVNKNDPVRKFNGKNYVINHTICGLAAQIILVVKGSSWFSFQTEPCTPLWEKGASGLRHATCPLIFNQILGSLLCVWKIRNLEQYEIFTIISNALQSDI